MMSCIWYTGNLKDMINAFIYYLDCIIEAERNIVTYNFYLCYEKLFQNNNEQDHVHDYKFLDIMLT